MNNQRLDTFQSCMIAEGCWDLAGFDPVKLGVDKCEKLFIEANQHLIDTGLAWELQGFFGRQATHLIDQGLCHYADTEE